MQDLLSRSRDLSRSGIIRLLCIGVLGMVAFYLCIDGLSRPKSTPTRSLGLTSQLDISSSAQDLEATVRALKNEMRKVEQLESKLASLITELTKSRKSSPKQDESEQIKELLSKIASLEEAEFGQNEMHDWFKIYKAGPGAHKYAHYLDAYHRHFKKFREQEKIVMVEVGVQSGGSINLWRDYFGASKLEYYGVDINPKTKQFEKEGVTIMLGDQSNRTFWEELKAQIPPAVDIFIDDGGHQMNQQVVTFEEMFWTVRDGGVYLCEDLHTSYWDEFQGAYLKEDSMMERSKSLVDAINAWHSRDARLKVDRWTESIRGLHFYDSMIFIEKLVTTLMVHVKGGDYWIPYDEHESNRKM